MRFHFFFLAAFLSTSVFAQINGEQFLNCFKKASDEVIIELKSEGKTSGVCSHLSQENLDKLVSVFADTDSQNNITWVSSDVMAKVHMIDIYDILKNEVECFKPVTKDTGLIPDLINVKSYHQNMNFTQRTLSKMIDAHIFKVGHDELSKFDFSYCAQ